MNLLKVKNVLTNKAGDILDRKNKSEKKLFLKTSKDLHNSYLKSLKKNALIGAGVGLGTNELIKYHNKKKLKRKD